ncbi:DJ-1/PfpI family protein [Dactylosporangium sp. AC04546]|uniref:DJ-1/PfpI family protein n=1 Tax=Dactylosporangium sp. AC04546 TaxID=2862460 RepID=UPI001EDE1965|nr:DJ-1/PfpI family protein [Dactylosporangium sp. AC04546]WVK80222.1 DJ-1/PfpI family protein [Dactylosporangium sp. AC04546]
MRIVIVLYPRMTALDAVGPYEVLSRLPGADLVTASHDRGPVVTDTGVLTLHADEALDNITNADIVVVPGGPDITDQQHDRALHEWLIAVDPTTTCTASVCSGALILGAAGLLQGRRATTHWLAMRDLARHGATPTHQRVVRDGKYATAAGVSAGIDLGLTLAAEVAGPQVAMGIQLAIEYDPEPPFDAGSPAKAPREVTAFLTANEQLVLRR